MSPVPASSARPEIGSVEVVGFDEGLLEQAAVLRTTIFGSTPEANDAYLRWKFLENPYFPEPLVQVAVQDERVVGFRGAMGTCWEVGERRHVLPQGADLMVDPDFRRRGIARALHRAQLEALPGLGIDVTLSLSAGTMGTAVARASGWRVLASLDATRFSRRRQTTFRRVVRRGRIAARLIAGAALRSGRSPADPFGGLDRRADDTVRIVDQAVADELAAIAARSAPGARLRHVRDAEYFAWRLRNPLSEYRVLLERDAYLVLQWSGRGSQVNVVDWRATTPGAVAELVRLAARHLQCLRIWEASLDEDLRRALSNVGGGSVPPGPSSSFLVRSATGERRDVTIDGLDPFELSSWDVKMLDSDEY